MCILVSSYKEVIGGGPTHSLTTYQMNTYANNNKKEFNSIPGFSLLLLHNLELFKLSSWDFVLAKH